MKFTVVATILYCSSLTMAASVSPRRINLMSRLQAKKVDIGSIGCQCIMSAPSKHNSDSTLCMCLNRKDGSENDSEKCFQLTDAVFTFCTDVTDTTTLWQSCVKNYCPCDGDYKTIPVNKTQF